MSALKEIATRILHMAAKVSDSDARFADELSADFGAFFCKYFTPAERKQAQAFQKKNGAYKYAFLEVFDKLLKDRRKKLNALSDMYDDNRHLTWQKLCEMVR
jgi:hypothetical protein